MLGTKLRALFQRKRGRDLFDLYRALERGAADPAQVIEAFGYYMAHEGTPIPRSAFLEALDERLADAGFCSDMASLLPAGVRYDPQEAGELVRSELLDRLPHWNELFRCVARPPRSGRGSGYPGRPPTPLVGPAFISFWARV